MPNTEQLVEWLQTSGLTIVIILLVSLLAYRLLGIAERSEQQ